MKELAGYLCKRLIAEGFTVQRYDAYKIDSVYLKLDFGVCNSIRIGNHPRKRYLKYRYNIGSFIKSIDMRTRMDFRDFIIAGTRQRY